MKISSVLVANRGEIACRIISTLKKLHIRSVAVYSDVDRDAMHVGMADEAYALGGATASESYLNQKALFEIIKKAKVDAVHPGYGFLSENAEFAAALAKRKVAFIGPSPSAMQLVGDKIQARALAKRLKVPTVPGIELESGTDARTLGTYLKGLEFPLMIKAAAGGGGRGMRRVNKVQDLASQLAAATREAEASFGKGDFFIEQLIEGARHIEVQIAGDSTGKVIALSDRDCSMQRRNQKVVEEAPAPFISNSLRQKMHKAACVLCAKANYQNLGTVEFLLAPDDTFYFLEVNSRLQVEHPVSELVLEMDFVELQIRIAEGLSFKKLLPARGIKVKGHAIECRLCAERMPQVRGDAFQSQTGSLELLQFPEAFKKGPEQVRVDSGVRQGDEVPPYYDSLLAKIVVAAENRSEALALMKSALSECRIAGISTNLPFLHTLIESPELESGQQSTSIAEELIPGRVLQERARALAAVLAHLATQSGAQSAGPWGRRNGFRLSGSAKTQLNYQVDGTLSNPVLEIQRENQYTVLSAAGVPILKIGQFQVSGSELIFELEGIQVQAWFYQANDKIWIDLGEGAFCIEASSSILNPDLVHSEGKVLLSSPLPGRILEVKVKVGDQVSQGQILVSMESMKMEHMIKAPKEGSILEIHVKSGQQVQAQTPLLSLE